MMAMLAHWVCNGNYQRRSGDLEFPRKASGKLATSRQGGGLGCDLLLPPVFRQRELANRLEYRLSFRMARRPGLIAGERSAGPEKARLQYLVR